MKTVLGVLIGLLVGLLGGFAVGTCSTAYLTSSDKNFNQLGRYFTKIMDDIS